MPGNFFLTFSSSFESLKKQSRLSILRLNTFKDIYSTFFSSWEKKKSRCKWKDDCHYCFIQGIINIHFLKLIQSWMCLVVGASGTELLSCHFTLYIERSLLDKIRGRKVPSESKPGPYIQLSKFLLKVFVQYITHLHLPLAPFWSKHYRQRALICGLVSYVPHTPLLHPRSPHHTEETPMPMSPNHCSCATAANTSVAPPSCKRTH